MAELLHPNLKSTCDVLTDGLYQVVLFDSATCNIAFAAGVREACTAVNVGAVFPKTAFYVASTNLECLTGIQRGSVIGY
jgi:hypothetical protein